MNKTVEQICTLGLGIILGAGVTSFYQPQQNTAQQLSSSVSSPAEVAEQGVLPAKSATPELLAGSTLATEGKSVPPQKAVRLMSRQQPASPLGLARQLWDERTSDLMGPALVKEAVEDLSEDELLDLMATYTRLAPDDIPAEVNVRDFADRLGEIYFGDSFARQDNYLDNPEEAAAMEFATRADSNNQAVEPRQDFQAQEKRIYASFANSDYQERDVMVKWSRADSPEVYVYDKYPINTSKDHNYVYLEQPNGWENGDYQVEIYSLADNLSLMARGNYAVN